MAKSKSCQFFFQTDFNWLWGVSVNNLMKWGCWGHWSHWCCWGCWGHWDCRCSKAWKITTEDFRVIQVLEFSFILMFWKKMVDHETSCWIFARNFMSEAVEVNRYYIFENWLMKLKFPKLRVSEPSSNKF